MNSRVYIDSCKFGRGVFALNKIPDGEKFLTLEGEIINFEETLKKGCAEPNAIQIEDDRYLDVVPPGVYLNHSCNPNAGVIRNRIVVALRDIAAGEEVTIDYSTTMQENSWTMACHCGESNCRKIVTDFRLLPKDVQERYLVLGVVQEFICRKETWVGFRRGAS